MLRYLSTLLLGPRPPLCGLWQRVGDNFAGCRIAIDSAERGLEGRLVRVPDRMRELGWEQGEVKWLQITRGLLPGCSLQDKSKLYDTRARQVAAIDYTPSRLRFVAADEIIVTPLAADRGSFSRWRRVRPDTCEPAH